MNDLERINDGFKHQKLIIMPGQIINTLRHSPLTHELYPVYIGYFPCARNHYINRPDGSPNHILIFNIDGKGIIRVGGKNISLECHQMFIIPKDTAHQYEADADYPWSIYWAHFDGDISEDISHLLNCIHQPIDIDGPNHSGIIHYFNEIMSLLEMGYAPDHLFHVATLFRSIFTRANHTSFIHSELPQQKDYVYAAMQYMQSHIQELRSLSDIARSVGISKNHLMVVFKEKTRTSPMDYFIHMKVQKACELLGTTEDTIKNIALFLGYNDPYYFSRLFKSVMATSPKAYRDKKIN